MSTPLPRALRRTTRTPSRNREGERQGGEPSRWDGSIDPCRKVARSGRAVRPPPTNRQRHEQPFTIDKNTSSSSSQGTFSKQAALEISVLASRFRAPPERFGLPIDDRRRKPFEYSWVRPEKKPHELLQIPSYDVQRFIKSPVHRVASLLKSQILVDRPYVNEPHVIVAVARGDAPSTAARFHGNKHIHVSNRRQKVKLVFYCISHRAPLRAFIIQQ